MKSDNSFTLKDIEKVLPMKTWYASIFVLPISKRISLFFINNRIFTPNQITLFGFLLKLLTAVMFIFGSYNNLIIGAVSYYFAYILDCVDGSVARLTNQASEFGRYLDHISDLAGDILILCSLAYSQGLLFSYMILGMIFIHLSESYISHLAGFAIKEKKGLSDFYLFKIFNRYRQWWFEKNFKSFLSFPDYTAFVFIVMPILNMPKKGLEIGFYLLFVIVCYTILSTFVSLHTNEKKFP